MPPLPDLTESWVGVCLEVAATVLVFAFGIPFALEQINVPEDLRHVIYRRRRPLRWVVLSLLASTSVMLGFIWWLHPTESGMAIQEYDDLISPPASGSGVVAASMMTLILLLPFASLYLRTSYRRDRVLGGLTRICSRDIGRCGHPDLPALLDIKYLGVRGEAGIEKAQVLEKLSLLAEEVQAQQRYAGDGLEEIVQAIEATLQEGGDAENCRQGVAILRRIGRQLRKCHLASAPDMGAALRALQRVGVLALRLNSEPVALCVLDTVTLVGETPASLRGPVGKILLDLGVFALEARRFFLAVAVLSRVEALARGEQPLSVERAADYLGLVAHFWAAGPTAQNRARLSLASMSFESSLGACLLSARDHYATLAQLDTADRLADMISGNSSPIA